MANIKLNNNLYPIPDSVLATHTADFIAHLGTIAGSGMKVVVGGVEYSVDSTKVSGAISEIETLLSGLAGGGSTGKTFKYGDTIEDGGCLYTYIGAETLDEYREGQVPMLESMVGMTWPDIVAQVGGGDEEVVWSVIEQEGVVTGVTADTFVIVPPQWTVAASSTDISGVISVMGEIESIPVLTLLSNAFMNCTNITNVILSEGISKIDFFAFRGCSSLTSISIPASVTDIETQAFLNCASLTNVIFAENSNLSYVGSNVFKDCNNLNYTQYNNGKYLGSTGNPYLYLEEPVEKHVSTFTIPNTTRVIGYQAFYDCYHLASITIPASVVHIGQYAFASAVNSISSMILSNVSFEEGSLLSVIGSEAFRDCKNLNNIVVPANVTKIQARAFGSCLGLENIAFEGTMEQWNAIDKYVDEAHPNNNWNNGVPATYVQCSDGQVAL